MEEQEQLTLEAKKSLSRKRIFYFLIAASVIMSCMIVWEIIEFFVH